MNIIHSNDFFPLSSDALFLSFGLLPSLRYIIYSKEQAFRHMTKWRSWEEQLLYIVVDEVLFNVWDALSLSMHREHREVYFPYLPHVFDILVETKDGQELYNYLIFIEEAKMGAIKGDTLAGRRARRTIDILLEYRASIFKKAENILSD